MSSTVDAMPGALGGGVLRITPELIGISTGERDLMRNEWIPNRWTGSRRSGVIVCPRAIDGDRRKKTARESSIGGRLWQKLRGNCPPIAQTLSKGHF